LALSGGWPVIARELVAFGPLDVLIWGEPSAPTGSTETAPGEEQMTWRGRQQVLPLPLAPCRKASLAAATDTRPARRSRRLRSCPAVRAAWSTQLRFNVTAAEGVGRNDRDLSCLELTPNATSSVLIRSRGQVCLRLDRIVRPRSESIEILSDRMLLVRPWDTRIGQWRDRNDTQ
jgi:hypothetical protein